jgi:hypothetical protein
MEADYRTGLGSPGQIQYRVSQVVDQQCAGTAGSRYELLSDGSDDQRRSSDRTVIGMY